MCLRAKERLHIFFDALFHCNSYPLILIKPCKCETTIILVYSFKREWWTIIWSISLAVCTAGVWGVFFRLLIILQSHVHHWFYRYGRMRWHLGPGLVFVSLLLAFVGSEFLCETHRCRHNFRPISWNDVLASNLLWTPVLGGEITWHTDNCLYRLNRSFS